ncbi:MAG: LOG family protein [Oculatellaceae cyanobacterium Prado106]|nr:LOG family protein [Oculatellaceae cyanobacterium Prado106]
MPDFDPSPLPFGDRCTLDAIASIDDPATYAVLQSTILQLWDAIENLTRICPPKHERYCVTLFGSARLQPTDPLYAGVQDLASELTLLGCDIVTGGGPGLMQAANEGSILADPADQTRSVGIRIDLGFEQEVNPFVEQVYHHRTFFSRLHHFVLLSDAFVVFPGGIGTTLEMMLIWQLLQVRKLPNRPFILVGEMWTDLVQWSKQHMLEVESPMVSAIDLTIPNCVGTCEEAVVLLKDAHSKWLS